MAEKPPELHTVDQILAMPDNGDFLADFLEKHQAMIVEMITFQMNNGGKVKGGFTIKLDYTLDKQLTMQVQAEHKFTLPKKPKATAALWTTIMATAELHHKINEITGKPKQIRKPKRARTQPQERADHG